eukprot:tig00000949_g5730.t1
MAGVGASPSVALHFGLLGEVKAGRTAVLEQLKLFCGRLIRERPEFSHCGDDRVTYTAAVCDLDDDVEESASWNSYLINCFGFIFVINSANEDGLPRCRRVFHDLLQNPRCARKPFLILANKQDLPGALSVARLEEVLQLESAAREAGVEARLLGVSAAPRPDVEAAERAANDERIGDGLNWLVGRVRANYGALRRKIERDGVAEQLAEQLRGALERREVLADELLVADVRAQLASVESIMARNGPADLEPGCGGGGGGGSGKAPASAAVTVPAALADRLREVAASAASTPPTAEVLLRENDAMRTQLFQLQSERSVLQRAISELRWAVEYRSGRLASAAVDHDGLQRAADAARREAEAARAEASAAIERAGRAAAELEALRSEGSRSASGAAQARAQMDALVTRVEAAEAARAEAEARAARSAAERDAARAETAAARKAAEEAAARLESARGRAEEEAAARRAAEEAAARLESARGRAEERAAGADRAGELRGELDSARRGREAAERERDEARRGREAAERERDEARGRWRRRGRRRATRWRRGTRRWRGTARPTPAGRGPASPRRAEAAERRAAELSEELRAARSELAAAREDLGRAREDARASATELGWQRESVAAARAEAEAARAEAAAARAEAEAAAGRERAAEERARAAEARVWAGTPEGASALHEELGEERAGRLKAEAERDEMRHMAREFRRKLAAELTGRDEWFRAQVRKLRAECAAIVASAPDPAAPERAAWGQKWNWAWLMASMVSEADGAHSHAYAAAEGRWRGRGAWGQGRGHGHGAGSSEPESDGEGGEEAAIARALRAAQRAMSPQREAAQEFPPRSNSFPRSSTPKGGLEGAGGAELDPRAALQRRRQQQGRRPAPAPPARGSRAARPASAGVRPQVLSVPHPQKQQQQGRRRPVSAGSRSPPRRRSRSASRGGARSPSPAGGRPGSPGPGPASPPPTAAIPSAVRADPRTGAPTLSSSRSHVHVLQRLSGAASGSDFDLDGHGLEREAPPSSSSSSGVHPPVAGAPPSPAPAPAPRHTPLGIPILTSLHSP